MTTGHCYLCGAPASLIVATGAGDGTDFGRWVCARCVYTAEHGHPPRPFPATRPAPRVSAEDRLHPQAETLWADP